LYVVGVQKNLIYELASVHMARTYRPSSVWSTRHRILSCDELTGTHLLGGDTAAPSGLYARLCHTFLVFLLNWKWWTIFIFCLNGWRTAQNWGDTWWMPVLYSGSHSTTELWHRGCGP